MFLSDSVCHMTTMDAAMSSSTWWDVSLHDCTRQTAWWFRCHMLPQTVSDKVQQPKNFGLFQFIS